MDLKFKLSLLSFSFESYNTVTRAPYTRQNCSNGLQKRFGDIKRTPLREVSNLIVAFQRKTEIVFVRNSNPFRLLFQRFGYRWLWHFEPEHATLVKLGLKRVYVSVSVKHKLHSILWNVQMIIAMMAENCEWANCLLSCDWRWLAICAVNSEFALNALLWSLSSPRDTFFRDRSDLEGRSYQTKEVKQKKRRKKKKKRAIKDHKNDWLTDATRLKLVMKNKWTRSSF